MPMAMTFHALGLVRQEHQGPDDGFPPSASTSSAPSCAAPTADRGVSAGRDRPAAALRRASPGGSRWCRAASTRPSSGPTCKTAARRALGLADDEFVILQLGRMVPRKGVDNVIRALALLPREQACVRACSSSAARSAIRTPTSPPRSAACRRSPKPSASPTASPSRAAPAPRAARLLLALPTSSSRRRGTSRSASRRSRRWRAARRSSAARSAASSIRWSTA